MADRLRIVPILPICLSAFLLISGDVYGQELKTPRPSNIICNTKLVDFVIVNGVIEAKNIRFGQSRGASAQLEKDNVKQSITLKMKQKRPLILIRRESKNSTLSIYFVAGEKLELSCESKSGSSESRTKFIQWGDGRCELEFGLEQTKKRSAVSLWHLAIAYPKECEERLFPHLNYLHPDWELKAFTDKVEEKLLDFDSESMRHASVQIADGIEGLTSKSFASRRKADRQIRRQGQLAVGFLRSIPTQAMSSEQRERVRQIISHLNQPSEDLPSSVATRMVGDISVWTSLAKRNDSETQKLARQNLRHFR